VITGFVDWTRYVTDFRVLFRWTIPGEVFYKGLSKMTVALSVRVILAFNAESRYPRHSPKSEIQPPSQ
jgi:hypothetical protein